jgi:D-sedoheptulose 7-phosphate isomerase
MDWLKQLVIRYPELDVCLPQIQTAIDLLKDCFAAGGKVLVCGNGGSASDAEHIVGELMKGYMSKRPLSKGQKQALNDAALPDGDYLKNHLMFPRNWCMPNKFMDMEKQVMCCGESVHPATHAMFC